jgi:hypothetical protein
MLGKIEKKKLENSRNPNFSKFEFFDFIPIFFNILKDKSKKKKLLK